MNRYLPGVLPNAYQLDHSLKKKRSGEKKGNRKEDKYRWSRKVNDFEYCTNVVPKLLLERPLEIYNLLYYEWTNSSILTLCG